MCNREPVQMNADESQLRKDLRHPRSSVIRVRLRSKLDVVGCLCADHLQHDEDDDRQAEATAEEPDEKRPTRGGFATHVNELLLHDESPFC
jgi:hypothetical protein